MPVLQPSPINIQTDEWKEARPHLMRALNYLIKDIYEWIANIQGLGSDPSSVITSHDHKSAGGGGDHPWADITASIVTYLTALQADILVTNVCDKIDNETITGSWTFPVGTIINGWIVTKPVLIGGIYLNITGADPNTELGYGTWTQVAKGQFLVGAP